MAFYATTLAFKKQIRPLKSLLTELVGTNIIRQCTHIRTENFSSVSTLSNNEYINFMARDFNQKSSLIYGSQLRPSSCVMLNTNPLHALSVSTINSKGISPILLKFYTTDTSTSGNQDSSLSKKEKLKKAVKEYGATVVIFHVAISLLSLGGCYLAVISGINMNSLPVACLVGSSEIASEVGLFVVAYAVHKALAPVRITITLASTPFIVRYLRKINVLKPPKP